MTVLKLKFYIPEMTNRSHQIHANWTLGPLSYQSLVSDHLPVANNKGRFIIFFKNINICNYQTFLKMMSFWIDTRGPTFSVVCFSITSSNELQVVSAGVSNDFP